MIELNKVSYFDVSDALIVFGIFFCLLSLIPTKYQINGKVVRIPNTKEN